MANNYNETAPNQMYAIDKMKEMEEEMNRFEEEILGGDPEEDDCVSGAAKPPFPPFPFPVNSHEREDGNYRQLAPDFLPQSMMHRQRMPGPPGIHPLGIHPPGIHPPGIRMGGPAGIRMGGPPGVAPGPRQMRPSFIPHQLHRPTSNMLMPSGIVRMPIPILPIKPKTISAAPTVYAAKPVKFTAADKIEEIDKAVETAAVVETTSVAQQPVHETLIFQQAMMQQQQQVQQQQRLQQQQQQQQQQAAMMMAGVQEAVPTKKTKKKKLIRTAAGQSWEDESLQEWDSNDFRIFCGDLGNEVNDDTLTKAFNRYPSFIKAKVVRDKRNGKSKGYGFVSFKDPNDFVQAMREMNGKYVGNRPIKLRKSMWKERNMETAKKKMREKQRLGLR